MAHGTGAENLNKSLSNLKNRVCIILTHMWIFQIWISSWIILGKKKSIVIFQQNPPKFFFWKLLRRLQRHLLTGKWNCFKKTNWRARSDVVFSITTTHTDTLYVFRLDAVQKTKKTELNVNELFGPPRKRSFLSLSTLREGVYVFRLNAVQKVMNTEKSVNELSGSSKKCSFLILSIITPTL